MYLTGNRQHRQWIIDAAFREQKLMPYHGRWSRLQIEPDQLD